MPDALGSVPLARTDTGTDRGGGAPLADLSALADAGWPAIEQVGVDGWVARFAHGVTRRANSVYPVGAVREVGTAIESVERLYRDRGLPSVFQLSEDDAQLRATLLARGYREDSETLVSTARLDEVSHALRASCGTVASSCTAASSGTASASGTVAASSVVVSEAPDDAWLSTWWAVDGRGGPAELETARGILTGVPSLYATVTDAVGAASVGRLALVEQGGTAWGGLYALATRADARGRGHAHAVIAALLEAGAEHGVSALWLQVLASNATARRLYDGLGFRRAATYRYLVAPGAPDSGC